MIKVVGLVAMVAVVCAGFYFVIIATVNMFRAVANRKEGVPLFPRWWIGPFTILVRPHQLTERGLAARRRVMYGTIGFFVCWLLGIAIGVVTGVAR